MADPNAVFCSRCGAPVTSTPSERAPFTTTPPSHYPTAPPAWTGVPPNPTYGYYQQYPALVPRVTNGLAIASMVLGILWLYWVGSILALVFGYLALAQIRERGEGGRGMAIAGVVLGWVELGIGVVVIVALAVASQHSPGGP